jgi:hypothetical protein
LKIKGREKGWVVVREARAWWCEVYLAVGGEFIGKQFLMMMRSYSGDSNRKEEAETSKMKQGKFATSVEDGSSDLAQGADITYALKLPLFFQLFAVRNLQLLPLRPPSLYPPLFLAFISKFVLPAVF